MAWLVGSIFRWRLVQDKEWDKDIGTQRFNPHQKEIGNTLFFGKKKEQLTGPQEPRETWNHRAGWRETSWPQPANVGFTLAWLGETSRHTIPLYPNSLGKWHTLRQDQTHHHVNCYMEGKTLSRSARLAVSPKPICFTKNSTGPAEAAYLALCLQTHQSQYLEMRFKGDIPVKGRGNTWLRVRQKVPFLTSHISRIQKYC